MVKLKGLQFRKYTNLNGDGGVPESLLDGGRPQSNTCTQEGSDIDKDRD